MHGWGLARQRWAALIGALCACEVLGAAAGSHLARAQDPSATTGVASTARSAPAAHAPAALDSAQLGDTPLPTVEDGYQGHIPGVVAQQNNGGAPGGGMQVQMRGVASINSGAAPLYVIDGVIADNETFYSGLNAITAAGPVPYAQNPEDNTPNRIADINPADIARIEFLKGPSASAIYGNKAAAGAILITTKQGTPGRASWHLTARGGTYLPANRLALRTFPTYASANAWWHADAGIAGDLPRALYEGPQNFQDQLFAGDTPSGEGDVSVAGTSGGLAYFASLLDKYDNGLMLHTGYSKQATRLNLSQTVSRRLTAAGTFYYAHSVADRGVNGNDNVDITPYSVFSTTPQFVDLRHNVGGEYVANPFAFANPFADAARIRTPSTVGRFIGGATLGWQAYQSARQTIAISAAGGADVAHERDVDLASSTLEIEQGFRFPGIVNIARATAVYDNGAIGVVHHYMGLHGIDATTSLGVTQDDRSVRNPDLVGIGLPPGGTVPRDARFQTQFQYAYRSRSQSVYLQEQVLALHERLALTAGITGDRNSADGAPSRLYAFPHATAAYRLPRLTSPLDALTLRAAVGRAGLAPGYGFVFNNAQNFYRTYAGATRAAIVGTDPNSNILAEVDGSRLRPEMSTEIETGLDASMFRSRLQLSATIYQKRISDLVLLGPTPTSATLNAVAFNGGQVTNQGLELSAQGTAIETPGGLRWLLSASFARNYSRVDALPNGPFTIAQGFGRVYGTYRAEVGRSVTEIVNVGASTRDGSPLQVGDAQPDFVVSAGSTISWHRWRLSGLVDWSNGGNVINLTNAYYDNGLFLLADSAASARRMAAVTRGLLPYVESASFVKVREVALSYDLPEALLGPVRGILHSARLTASARNPFAAFHYSGLDPEVSDFGNTPVTRGQEVTPYPPARSFFLSVDLGL